MIDHHGNVIDLPYFGCYSGCVTDYCFVFGIQVSAMQYFVIIMLLGMTIFLTGFLIGRNFFRKIKKTEDSEVQDG